MTARRAVTSDASARVSAWFAENVSESGLLFRLWIKKKKMKRKKDDETAAAMIF